MRHRLFPKGAFKFLISLKLATSIMLLLSGLIAIGTLVEARFDAEAANKLIYNTYWMKSLLGILTIVLVAVMVDRWPWRKKHIPFLLAHVGIIILLLGSVVTQKFGLDGIMRIELASSSRLIATPLTDVFVFQSSDGLQFEETFKKEVDFFPDVPSVDFPLKIPAGSFDIQIIDYQRYALPSRKIIASNDPLAGSALMYELKNSGVSQRDWLFQPNRTDTVRQKVGGAEIVLSPQWLDFSNQNVILLVPHGLYLKYYIFRKDHPKPDEEGVIREGNTIELGWMNLTLKISDYFPLADKTWQIVAKDRPSPLTKPAIKISYQGQERWMLLNDVVRMARPGSLIRFVYSQRKYPLDFAIALKSFEVERYPGSTKISDYRSVVSVSGGPDQIISMNVPLKIDGLTFYQAGFEEDDRSGPTASILSVNRDPGRALKYLGAAIMSLGIILLFYFRKIGQLVAASKEI
ncbi:MAG: cytochrome c biogenesis protein ResB [Bdellovibrionales bacterium]|nr:cytochrome c biogenesis protein ResB [Oligoflexia bacterium]